MILTIFREQLHCEIDERNDRFRKINSSDCFKHHLESRLNSTWTTIRGMFEVSQTGLYENILVDEMDTRWLTKPRPEQCPVATTHVT